MTFAPVSRDEIIEAFRVRNPEHLARLRARANQVRAERVGEMVHLRGLIEISNHCCRNCLYCGVRAERREIVRYRMTIDEILSAAAKAVEYGYGTVVLQAGEDAGISDEQIAEIVAAIKERYTLAVTLSLGERPDSVFQRWCQAGADRYLLRVETTNPRLFGAIHPHTPGSGFPKTTDRAAMLRRLRSMGYEIGSGVMIGLPGQTAEDLADDLAFFQELDLDMIGTGPYLPHPRTPLGIVAELYARGGRPGSRIWEEMVQQTGFTYPVSEETVPATNIMGLTMIALTRLTCPEANIPSTTAIATLDGRYGRISGLQSGANVIMPNLTPMRYRPLYEIYPNKAAKNEEARETHEIALRQIAEANRIPGVGPGGRVRR